MIDFMNRAIELAIENIGNGGTPYGAVLTCGNEVISEGVNTMHESFDVAGHAEMIAIRKAQSKLKTNDLSHCVIYASGHPCPMCLSAIAIVGIKEVYYSSTVEDASEVGLTISKEIYEYIKNNESNLDIMLNHIPIEKDSMDPMKKYKSL